MAVLVCFSMVAMLCQVVYAAWTEGEREENLS